MARLLLAFVLASTLSMTHAAQTAVQHDFDVVVYGGTSGGMAAAVQTARMGKTVVLVEPGRHLGGLTSGGLGATDIGNKAAIGGIAREFYRRVARHYAGDAAWVQQTRDEFRKQAGATRRRKTRCGPSSPTSPRRSTARCSARPRCPSASASGST